MIFRIKACRVMGAIAVLTACVPAAATIPEKPNILFIITDQQVVGAMSAAGNPFVKTAAMDPLAARGVRFAKSYCTYPRPPAVGQLPPLPANFDATQDEPSVLAAFRDRQKKSQDPLSQGNEVKWREYRWAYYHLTEVVDGLVGQVLRALADSPFADNTLIVFTSDHGEMAGSHR